MDRFESRESYTRSIERSRANEKRITSDPCWEMEDSGLSLWGSRSMRDKADTALEAYDLGDQYGLDSPACYTRILVDSSGNLVSDRRVKVANRHAGYGTTTLWLVEEPYRKTFGRKWIPTGTRSRIQKKHGLHEVRMVTKAFGIDAVCSGLGMPVTYFCVEDWDADLLPLKNGQPT